MIRVEEKARIIINKLPESLQDDLKQEQFQQIISSWKIFKDNFSFDLMNKMKYFIKEKRFSPNDEIFIDGNSNKIIKIITTKNS